MLPDAILLQPSILLGIRNNTEVTAMSSSTDRNQKDGIEIIDICDEDDDDNDVDDNINTSPATLKVTPPVPCTPPPPPQGTNVLLHSIVTTNKKQKTTSKIVCPTNVTQNSNNPRIISNDDNSNNSAQDGTRSSGSSTISIQSGSGQISSNSSESSLSCHVIENSNSNVSHKSKSEQEVRRDDDTTKDKVAGGRATATNNQNTKKEESPTKNRNGKNPFPDDKLSNTPKEMPLNVLNPRKKQRITPVTATTTNSIPVPSNNNNHNQPNRNITKPSAAAPGGSNMSEPVPMNIDAIKKSVLTIENKVLESKGSTLEKQIDWLLDLDDNTVTNNLTTNSSTKSGSPYHILRNQIHESEQKKESAKITNSLSSAQPSSTTKTPVRVALSTASVKKNNDATTTGSDNTLRKADTSKYVHHKAIISKTNSPKPPSSTSTTEGTVKDDHAASKAATTSNQILNKQTDIKKLPPSTPSLNKGIKTSGTAKSPIMLCDSDDDGDDNDCCEPKVNEELSKASLAEQEKKLTNEMKLLSRHCWVCASPLRQNTPKTIEFNYDDYPLYEMHSHPALQCPICRYCSEYVVDAERKRLGKVTEEDPLVQNDDDMTTTTATTTSNCAGCGKDEIELSEGTTLFVCDDIDKCGRQFCQPCVAKAYGGGDVGDKKVLKLLSEGDNVPWKCPVCDAPEQLQILRQVVLANVERIDDVNDEDEAATTSAKKVAPRRPIASLLNDLIIAEEEWNEYDEELTAMEKSIEEENASSGDDAVELNEDDQEYILKLRRHLVNVEGLISSLQEEAEMDHNISTASLYRDGLGIVPSGTDQGEEPEYATAATKALNEHEKQSRLAKKLNRSPAKKNPSSCILDPRLYKRDDFFEDAEDLCNENADESADREYLWSKCDDVVTEEEIKDAFRIEERRIARMMLPAPKKVSEVADEEEHRQYELEVSGRRSTKSNRTSFARDEFTPQLKQRRIEASKFLKLTSPRKVNNGGSTTGQQHRKQSPHSSSKPSNMRENLISDLFPLDETKSKSNPMHNFQDSDMVLCEKLVSGRGPVTVAEQLSTSLKKHQIIGIKFMWENCFGDFADNFSSEEKTLGAGGCVLAHHMGLGKSLSVITLLHSVMRHPTMLDNVTNGQSIRCVLLVAPVNTIANWEAEFDKWTGKFDPFLVYNLSQSNSKRRHITVHRWKMRGGILLASPGMVRSFHHEQSQEQKLQPDVLVVDEAHIMLKSEGTKIFKALRGIQTHRKIEYYQLINFVRPGALGPKSDFERNYAIPIGKGMATDVSCHDYYNSLLKSKELSDKVRPYVDRKGDSELRNELPPLFDVALYVRQTSLQGELYRLYNRYKRSKGGFKFITQHSALYPVHNHPGCLILGANNNGSNTPSNVVNKEKWWEDVFKKTPREKAIAIDRGFKIVILLHILALAQKKDEKVLVFSNCKDTLSYIEYVLRLKNWKENLPSLKKDFPGMNLGGWTKSKDYLRIDGEIDADTRGRLVKQFNADGSQVRAFLLTCEAGGVGINLQAASRVVLIDNHFNPAVMAQSVCRAHRLGQEKPVFCYRLLTEKTTEEKVFNRCVNKIALGLRVIDEQDIERCFTTRELSNLSEIPLWVRCTKCGKMRLLPNTIETIPKDWRCEMNTHDPVNNNCEASEKDEPWYDNYRERIDPVTGAPVETDPSATTEEDVKVDPVLKRSNVSPDIHDDVLEHLKKLSKRTPMITKHVYHDSLLQAKDEKETLEDAKRLVEMAEAAKRKEEMERVQRQQAMQQQQVANAKAALAVIDAVLQRTQSNVVASTTSVVAPKIQRIQSNVVTSTTSAVAPKITNTTTPSIAAPIVVTSSPHSEQQPALNPLPTFTGRGKRGSIKSALNSLSRNPIVDMTQDD